jgi:hypothetical protein
MTPFIDVRILVRARAGLASRRDRARQSGGHYDASAAGVASTALAPIRTGVRSAFGLTSSSTTMLRRDWKIRDRSWSPAPGRNRHARGLQRFNDAPSPAQRWRLSPRAGADIGSGRRPQAQNSDDSVDAIAAELGYSDARSLHRFLLARRHSRSAHPALPGLAMMLRSANDCRRLAPP